MPDSSDQSGQVATDADFDLGRTALLEITSAESIGAPAGSIEEGDGVITVYFDTTLPGYPDWRWTVSISHVDGEQPGGVVGHRHDDGVEADLDLGSAHQGRG